MVLQSPDQGPYSNAQSPSSLTEPGGVRGVSASSASTVRLGVEGLGLSGFRI